MDCVLDDPCFVLPFALCFVLLFCLVFCRLLNKRNGMMKEGSNRIASFCEEAASGGLLSLCVPGGPLSDLGSMGLRIREGRCWLLSFGSGVSVFAFLIRHYYLLLHCTTNNWFVDPCSPLSPPRSYVYARKIRSIPSVRPSSRSSVCPSVPSVRPSSPPPACLSFASSTTSALPTLQRPSSPPVGPAHPP